MDQQLTQDEIIDGVSAASSKTSNEHNQRLVQQSNYFRMLHETIFTAYSNIEGIQNSGIPGYHWVFTPSYLQFIITLGGMLIWGSTICIPPPQFPSRTHHHADPSNYKCN